MTALAAPARFNFGRAISRTFGAIGGNFLSFLLLALLLSAVPTIVIEFAGSWLTGVLSQNNPSSYGLISGLTNFGGALLAMVPAYILAGSITHGAIVHFDGGRASLGECLSTGLRFALPLTGLGILTIIGLFLWALPLFLFVGVSSSGTLGFYNPFLILGGAAALAIPLVLAVIRWSVAAPAVVVERAGVFEAFRRSGDLTRDNRWAIFFLVLIVSLIAGAILMATAFVSTAAMAPLEIAASIGYSYYMVYALNLLFSAIVAVIFAAGAAALYYELRTTKEGIRSDELAKVFD